MNELILEVEDIIRTQKLIIDRNKKYHEYPFMNDCDHFYRLVLLHKTLEVWERCLQLLERYRKKRCIPIESFKSDKFEKIFQVDSRYSGFIPRKTQAEVIEYIKTLEWKLQEKAR